MKLKDLEEHLIKHFNAEITSINEIEKYKHYSLTGDKEHDYSLLERVYKIPYKEGIKENNYDVVFILVFCKNGNICDFKILGTLPEKLINYLFFN